jgi:hypothetical protein
VSWAHASAVRLPLLGNKIFQGVISPVSSRRWVLHAKKYAALTRLDMAGATCCDTNSPSTEELPQW